MSTAAVTRVAAAATVRGVAAVLFVTGTGFPLVVVRQQHVSYHGE